MDSDSEHFALPDSDEDEAFDSLGPNPSKSAYQVVSNL